MTNKFDVPLDRLARLTKAKSLGSEAIPQEERAISQEILGPDVFARDKSERINTQDCPGMTAFQATMVFGRKLHDAVTKFAGRVGAKAPRPGKYDLVFATTAMFKQVWQCRQVVDELGIPHGFYLKCAFRYWEEKDESRIPLPSQLCRTDVIAYVAGEWSDALTQEGSRNAAA